MIAYNHIQLYRQSLGRRVGDIDFVDLMNRIRQARGQTQEELARELDVTVGTMNGWENGRHRSVRVQRRRLTALAESLGLESAGKRKRVFCGVTRVEGDQGSGRRR